MKTKLLLLRQQSAFSGTFRNRVCSFTKHPAFLLPILLLWMVCGSPLRAFAQAPVISYSSPHTYQNGTAITALGPTTGGVASPVYLNTPTDIFDYQDPVGMTVDKAGNVYIVQLGSGIYKLPAGGGSPVLVTAAFTINNLINAMATDAAGNLYVANSPVGSPAQITKIPAGGGNGVSVWSGVSNIYSLTTDVAGNIYAGSDSSIIKIPVGGGKPIIIPSGGTGQSTSIVLDKAGNIYVADYHYDVVHNYTLGWIKKIPAGGGAPVTFSSSNLSVTKMAIDKNGNIFVPGPNSTMGMIPAGGGNLLIISTGFNSFLSDMASDGNGNIYTVDNYWMVDPPYSHDAAVKKINFKGVYGINPSLPAGLNFDSTSGVISGTPTADHPSTDYTVTAYNNSGFGSAVVNVKVSSTNANLANLAISNGILVPAFASGTTSYTAGVTTAVTSIKVTPTTSDSGATVKVNGITVASGSASAPIALTSGPNIITITVTAFDGTTTKAYTLTVTQHTPSSNANLAKLSVNIGTLTPVFSAATTAYTVNVTTGTDYITVTPTTGDINATIKMIVGGHVPWNPAWPINLGYGPNTIPITVTAEDGITTKTYTLTVFRAYDTYLNSLWISNGTLSPRFTMGITNYTARLSSVVKSITVTPTVDYYYSTAKVNGVAVASGAASAPIPLTIGPNIITIIVTGPDGTSTKTYTLTVTQYPASTNAHLADLSVSSGGLTPAFAPGTTAYTANIPDAPTMTLTPTVSDSAATISLNGIPLPSGKPYSFTVTNGQLISLVVTAQDGTTTLTYTLTLKMQASSNAFLMWLAMEPGGFTMSPYFSINTYKYTASVANTVTSVAILPITNDAGSTVRVNGAGVSSGAYSKPVPLAVGPNVITTLVSASDGITTRTYTITITRADVRGSSSLVGLALNGPATLSPAFAVATTGYTANVPFATTSVTATPTAGDVNATITVNGETVPSGTASSAIPLVIGANTITTIVTANGGATSTTYTVTITRGPASANANLIKLALSSGTLSPAFGIQTFGYTASVPDTVNSITVTPQTNNPYATVTVNGVAVASLTASKSIPLALGPNVITTFVKAENGITNRTYTVTVTRADVPGSSSLVGLALSSPAALSPAFAVATTGYTANVPFATSSVTVTPLAGDVNATVTVNGATVPSGTASSAIPLSIGVNTVTTVVTANGGGASTTYTVTITRGLASANANLIKLALSSGTLSPAFGIQTFGYTASVPDSVSTITVMPQTNNPYAKVTVNGVLVASLSASQSIPLSIGPNMITAFVTAEDGITTRTYTVTVTRASPDENPLNQAAISANEKLVSPLMVNDGLTVHQGVTPNGDGINDFLFIDGISNYPDNRLVIMNRSGLTVFEAHGYDNMSKIFDGHSNKTGAMQLPGTYFYSLQYKTVGVYKYKTGFFILKY